ncbi:MAG: transposase [Polyangiaceae bacterium]|nr:transposase [Polyangiaceae bacterium]
MSDTTVWLTERFDSAVRFNVHFHSLALDGVYVQSADGAGLRFPRLPKPTEEEVYEVAERTVKRVVAILEKKGRALCGHCRWFQHFSPNRRALEFLREWLGDYA